MIDETLGQKVMALLAASGGERPERGRGPGALAEALRRAYRSAPSVGPMDPYAATAQAPVGGGGAIVLPPEPNRTAEIMAGAADLIRGLRKAVLAGGIFAGMTPQGPAPGVGNPMAGPMPSWTPGGGGYTGVPTGGSGLGFGSGGGILGGG